MRKSADSKQNVKTLWALGKLGRTLRYPPMATARPRDSEALAKLATEMQGLDQQALTTIVTLAEENQDASAKELRGLIAAFGR